MASGMSLSRYFALLGAPLKNVRWSWGAERPSDGALVLRQWEDHILEKDGERFIRLWNYDAPSPPRTDLGALERLRHIRQIEKGRRCFIILVVAEDKRAQPRKIVSFNYSEVFPTDSPQRIGSYLCVRLGRPISREAMQATASHS